MPGYAAISSNLFGTSAGTIKMAMSLAANTAANCEQFTITLATGANTITIPSWAAGMIITPPQTNNQTMTLKGITGDTGITLNPALPALIPFPAVPQATFVITSGGNQTAPTVVTFF